MPRVVYIDDEPGLLEITKDFLEDDGDIQVDTERLPEKALERFVQGAYDVIVSDYQMPRMDGIQLLKALRGTGDRTPFILFTGRGRQEVAIEALNSGADFYLQKGGEPKVQFRELKNAIIQLSQRRNAERLAVQAERKYQDLVEGANSIILKLDPSGNIVFLNTFAKQFFGTDQGAVGRPVVGTLFMPQDHQDYDFSKYFTRFLSTGKFGDSYTFPVVSGGEKAWVSWTVREVRDTNDRVTEFLVIGNDVTALKNAEVKLQHSSAVLRATLDSSDEGILVTTNDGVITEHNRRFQDLWKVPASIMASRSGEKLIDFAKDQLKDFEQFVKFVDDCYAEPDMDDHRILEFKDGRSCELYSTPERIEGEVTGRYWSFKDITRQKAFESDLLQRHDNIRSLFANNPAKMLLFEPDSGRIVHANRAACLFYGRAEEAMKRMSLSEITTLPFAEYSERMGLARTRQRNYFDAPHRLADGTVRDVAIFIAPVVYKGRPRLFSIVQDVSGTKGGNRLLDANALKNNRILDYISEGMVAIGADNRIVYANQKASEVLLTPMEKMIGTDLHAFISEESMGALAPNLVKRRKGEKGQMDYKLRRGDGSEFWASLSANPVLSDGVFEGTIYSLVDITERKKAGY